MDAFESTPRLAFLSPEPASGKTRALEVTEPLVPRPVEAVNVTPAYLFRKVADEDGRPTILFDEIDTVFGPKAKDNDVAGGNWPTLGRDAAVALVTEGKQGSPSLGARLLADIRIAFDDADKMSTEDILAKLHALDDAAWGDLRGKPLNNLGLSRLLNPYGIKPKLVRIGGDVIRGYVRQDFHDAWKRYLLPAVAKAVTPVTDVARDER
jgi:hypothetical protein